MKSYLVKTPKLVQRIFPKRVWAFPSKNKEVFLTFDDGPIPEVTPWVLSLLKKHNAKATFFCIGDNVRKHPEICKQLISEGHTIGNHTFHHVNGKETALREYVEDVKRAEECVKHEVERLEAGSGELEAQNLKQNMLERERTSCFEKEHVAPNTQHPTPNIYTEHSRIGEHPAQSVQHPSSVIRHRSLATKLFRPPYGRLNSKQAKALRNLGYNIIMWDVLSADFDQDISEEKCLQNVLKNIKAGSIVIFHDSLKAEKNLRYALPKVLEYIDKQNWECVGIPSN